MTNSKRGSGVSPPIPKDTDLRSQIEGILKLPREEYCNVPTCQLRHDTLKEALTNLIQERDTKLKEALLGGLPEKIEEGDGWDIYFSNGKEKGKVRPCCPGDDIAYVQNLTLDQTRTAINKVLEEL